MTPAARAAVREILGTLDEEKAEETAASLAQQTKKALHDDANDIDNDDANSKSSSNSTDVQSDDDDDDEDDDDGRSANSTDAQKDNKQSSQEPVLSSLGTETRTHRTETKTNQAEEKPKNKKGTAPPKSSFPRPKPMQKAKVQKAVTGGQFACKEARSIVGCSMTRCL